jgi:galactoside O-acetyltransferase
MRRILGAARREMGMWLAAALRSLPGMIGIKLRAKIYSNWFANAPKRLRVLSNVYVNGWANVTIGDEVTFDRACSLEAATGLISIGARTGFNCGVWIGADSGRIMIGSDVLIGPYVVMRAADHRHEAGISFKDQGHEPGEIFVGDNVWIGAQACLLSGAHVGKNSIIAAGSVVRGVIPENSLAAGVPAKVVRQLC